MQQWRPALRAWDNPRMSLVRVEALPEHEPRSGWSGRFFHSAHMTFAYYTVAPGSRVHEHAHPEEEVWNVIEGELEVTLADTTDVIAAGQAFVVPAGEQHAVRALTRCRVIVVDWPVRASVGGVDTGAPIASDKQRLGH
jgi:quercetin dioxygenase-like cupin family protein